MHRITITGKQERQVHSSTRSAHPIERSFARVIDGPIFPNSLVTARAPLGDLHSPLGAQRLEWGIDDDLLQAGCRTQHSVRRRNHAGAYCPVYSDGIDHFPIRPRAGT